MDEFRSKMGVENWRNTLKVVVAGIILMLIAMVISDLPSSADTDKVPEEEISYEIVLEDNIFMRERVMAKNANSNEENTTDEISQQSIVVPEQIIAATYVISSEKGITEVYNEADETSSVMGYLENEDIVTAIAIDDYWLKLDIGDQCGFIMLSDATEHINVIKEINQLNVLNSGFDYGSDMNTHSGLSVDEIEYLLEGTYMSGLGTELYKNETKYGVNTYLAIAVARMESGLGKSDAALYSNNLFGILTASGKIKYFNSKSECIEYFYALIANSYIAKGYSTPYNIKSKYCDTEAWVFNVVTFMNQDSNKISALLTE